MCNVPYEMSLWFGIKASL